MDKNAACKSIGVWLIVFGVGLLDSAVQSWFLGPRLGELMSHVVSTLMLMIVVLMCSSVLVNRFLKDYVNRDLFIIGFMWITLSVSFEFLVGHYVLDQPWSALVHDYNLFAGRVWILVLMTELIGPWFMASNKR
jgi:xanthine/uracil permease